MFLFSSEVVTNVIPGISLLFWGKNKDEVVFISGFFNDMIS